MSAAAATPEQLAEIRTLLAERRLRLYGQARFTASARRAAWASLTVPAGYDTSHLLADENDADHSDCYQPHQDIDGYVDCDGKPL